jgi:hypothetical protein
MKHQNLKYCNPLLVLYGFRLNCTTEENVKASLLKIIIYMMFIDNRYYLLFPQQSAAHFTQVLTLLTYTSKLFG